MRIARLFLLLLICIALPFNNVAAATMIHCVQTEGTAGHESHAGAHPDHAGMHDHGQSAQDQHDIEHADEAACSHCSYCQDCVSAIASVSSSSLRALPPTDEHLPFTVAVRQSVKDQPFRPPMFALV